MHDTEGGATFENNIGKIAKINQAILTLSKTITEKRPAVLATVIVVDVVPGRADVPELEPVHWTSDSFITLITTDHVSDEAALRNVIRSPARYIGMIGSRHKCETILRHLRADGISEDALRRVYAPRSRFGRSRARKNRRLDFG